MIRDDVEKSHDDVAHKDDYWCHHIIWIVANSCNIPVDQINC